MANQQTTCIPPTAPSSPMAAKSIGSIPMVPTTGETSPTSVLVDVTAETPNGISELKRFQGYSNDLLLPESMIYGNELIKVWSLEDDEIAGENTSYPKTAMMMRHHHQEEPTYNKASMVLREAPIHKKAPVVPFLEPPSWMEVDGESPLAEVDDLFQALPPTSISLPPRVSSLAPPSPPASPCVGRCTQSRRNSSISTIGSSASFDYSGSASSGSTSNTIVLGMNGTDASMDDITTPTKPQRGHRRGHRRQNSHFDFQFT